MILHGIKTGEEDVSVYPNPCALFKIREKGSR